MKNILKTIGVLSLAVVLFAGCDLKFNADTKSDETTTTTQASKGNCSAFECMKQIKASNTVEEINNIIGFEGKVKEESAADATAAWKLYSWELTDDTSIEIKKYSNTSYLEAIYPKDMIKNEKVDLSQANDMKAKINQDGGLKYDEVKEMLGNTDGVLVKRSDYADTYIWANTNGGNITANFNSNGKCTSFTGLIK